MTTTDPPITERIPPGGTPGYFLLTLRGAYPVYRGIELSAALENLTNENYRVHGSGQNGSGRALVFAMNAVF